MVEVFAQVQKQETGSGLNVISVSSLQSLSSSGFADLLGLKVASHPQQ